MPRAPAVRNHSAQLGGRPARRIESSCMNGTRARSAGRRTACARSSDGLATGVTNSPNRACAVAPSKPPRPNRMATSISSWSRSNGRVCVRKRSSIPGTRRASLGSLGTSQRVANDGVAPTVSRPLALPAAQHAHAAREPLEALAQMLRRKLSRIGQRETPRSAAKQLDPEMALQTADLVADRGGRHVQLAGCARKAQKARRGLECAQRSQWWQGLVRHEFISSVR